MTIQNNKLNYNYAAAGYAQSAIRSRGYFARDYRLQLDWDITSITTPTANKTYAVVFQVKRVSDSITLATVARERTSAGVDNYYSNGNDVAIEQYATADTTGSFRIERSGFGVDATTTIFVWSGTQWEWNGDPAGRIVSNDNGDNWVKVKILFVKELNGTLNSNIDNFDMIYGDYICPPGA